MKKTEIPAFLAMTLYGCGFLASFELMQSRPEPFTGITAAALAHLICVLIVSVLLPVIFGAGKKGRILVGICILSGLLVRLPGVDGWLNDWLVRSTVQMGQGVLAATSFSLFFCLTPQEKWVDRFVLAWLAGMAGKEIIVLIGGRSPSALYMAVGLVLAVNMVAALVCVTWGGLPTTTRTIEIHQVAWRPFVILIVNTFAIAAVLGLLSGWIGSFHVEWAKASLLAPRIAAPAMLALAGLSLRRDFTAGFIRMARLCAVLCLAMAGMAVLDREAVNVSSIPYLTVGCQTAFYVCMTLALVRLAITPRYLGLAAVIPYAAMIVSGLVSYKQTRLDDHQFSLLILLCLVAFLTFFVSAKTISFAIPATRFIRMDLIGFFEYYQLSNREREVATLLSCGLANSDIASQLFLSRHTINSHVRSVCEKSGISSRAELVKTLRECVQAEA